MNKGFLIIAVKHSYYGNMAFNLAVSIKAQDASAKIALIHDDIGVADLNDQQKSIFDHMIKRNNDWKNLRLETISISPFEKNIILDADQVWINSNVQDLFSILDSTCFTAVNHNYYDVEAKKDLSDGYIWMCDIEDAIKTYRINKGKVWKTRGEFMLFKKSKKVENLFATTATILANPKIKTSRFAGGIPDEWAYNIALNKSGMDMHEGNWQPSFWPVTFKGKSLPLWEMNKKFYTLSTGGATFTPHQKKIYDLVMDGACYKLGFNNLLPLRSKNNYIPERNKNGKAILH